MPRLAPRSSGNGSHRPKSAEEADFVIIFNIYMKIFPVINCSEEPCFRERMKIAKDLPFIGEKKVHIDISDGIFASSDTWVTPEELKKEALDGVVFVAHLMLGNPGSAVRRWIEAGAKEVVVHIESDADLEEISSVCSESGTRLVLAANPGTPISSLVGKKDISSDFLLLAVRPGPAGQPMSFEVIPRIKELRAALPDATIEVDGGVTPETVRLMKEAGADVAVAGTYIFIGLDPAESYRSLLSAAR